MENQDVFQNNLHFDTFKILKFVKEMNKKKFELTNDIHVVYIT